MYILENDRLRCEFSEHGAELKVLFDKKKDKNLLWNGDPKFWKRTSPVLFPLVGSLRNGEYRYNGNIYKMSQHGFARDMDFEVINATGNTLTFVLTDNEESYKKYPFHFRLVIEYVLNKSSLSVTWKVTNLGDEGRQLADNDITLGDGRMYFSIGAHPAFLCDLHDNYFFKISAPATMKNGLTDNSHITTGELVEGGLFVDTKKEYKLDGGYLAINEELFANDALVLENSQTGRVALCDKNKDELLALSFDAPVVGLWSPPKVNAPFVCIEPWYGRCDGVQFDGELSKREWGNTLEVNETFTKGYTIEIL